MAAVLSEDDFQCLQNQLLELKTKNYSLEERNNKYFGEYTKINHQYTVLREEYEKAQKVIKRNKNAHEMQMLLHENDKLQRKLQSQEDEFRLQNETLMKEVLALTDSNEKLEKDLELSKADEDSSANKENCEEFLRLQAENNSLKKMLRNSLSDAVEADRSFSELDASIDAEEKFLLKEKITKQQKRHKEDTLQLQNENEKLIEKLKRKQESILQLHAEKEKMYTDHKKQYESLQAEKNAAVQNLKDEIQSLCGKIKSFSSSHDYNSKLLNSVEDMDANGLEAKVQFMAGEKASFECSLNETRLHIRDYEIKLNNATDKLIEMESVVKELQGKNDSLEKNKIILEKEKSDLQMEAMEQSNLAEKRKIHMDEMNNHILEMTNKHSREIENLTQQLSQEQEALQKLYHKEKETRLELIQARNEIQSIHKELDNIKNEHIATQQGLKDADKIVEDIKIEFEEKSKIMEEEHEAAIKAMEEELTSQIQSLTIQFEVAQAQKIEFEENVLKSQQEVKDLIDEKRITEKKHSSLVKDLKRQLLMERKRAEKLQDRLQETLNEQNRSIDEILHSSSVDKAKGDTSSISSWSYVSAEAVDRETRENPSHSDGSSCGRESPSLTSPGPLESETSKLLSNITHLQQKNWILEEKVNHLEMSNEALVDDLLKKTALIQFYCMEGRSNIQTAGAQDKLTIKRIVDFIKDKGDENLREVNRKMQRMLEETLTKNMNLQKDIVTLTNEISRLTSTKLDPALQSTVFVEGI